MDNIVFLIKSHIPHLTYTKQLVETTAKHNKDNIPVYLSIPKNQYIPFKNSVDTSLCNVIFDEDIVKGDVNQDWFNQQLVKMKFSETGLCKNYLWIDGDSYFIKDFHVSDFMFDEETPYTTIHENKD